MNEPDSNVSLAVDAAAAAYAGMWILMRVEQRDEYDTPTQGAVIAAGRQRRDIQQSVLASVRAAQQSGEQFYVFRGFERSPAGRDWRGALEAIVMQGGRRGRRRR